MADNNPNVIFRKKAYEPGTDSANGVITFDSEGKRIYLDGNVYGEQNVQADWNQTVGTAPDFIKNKPEIPDAVIGSYEGDNWTSLTIGTVTKSFAGGADWDAEEGEPGYIENKPFGITTCGTFNYQIEDFEGEVYEEELEIEFVLSLDIDFENLDTATIGTTVIELSECRIFQDGPYRIPYYGNISFVLGDPTYDTGETYFLYGLNGYGMFMSTEITTWPETITLSGESCVTTKIGSDVISLDLEDLNNVNATTPFFDDFHDMDTIVYSEDYKRWFRGNPKLQNLSDTSFRISSNGVYDDALSWNNSYNTVMPCDNSNLYIWTEENAIMPYFANWNTIVSYEDSELGSIAYKMDPQVDGTVVTYNDDWETFEKYGYLYSWNAVMGYEGSHENSTDDGGYNWQGIAPQGWHIPSEDEYQNLFYYLAQYDQYYWGPDDDRVCNLGTDTSWPSDFCHIAKSLASKEGWDASQSEHAVGNGLSDNNNSAFNVYPAGCFDPDIQGHYDGDGRYAMLWTSTPDPSDASKARCVIIDYDKATVSIESVDRRVACSLRIKYNNDSSDYYEYLANMNNGWLVPGVGIKWDGSRWRTTKLGGQVGYLDTSYSYSLSPNSNESFSNSIALHRISKTGDYDDLQNTPNLAAVATSGSYNDLQNKPTINNGMLTINQNGVAIGTFSANEQNDKTINIQAVASISSLTDVVISTLENEQILQYNSSTGKWVNAENNGGTSIIMRTWSNNQ